MCYGNGQSSTAMAHIIYIDDSAVHLAQVAEALEHEGYKVTTRTGIVGLEPQLPTADLVLIDFHMPGMDGGQTLAAIRQLTANQPKQPLFYLYTSDKERGADYRELGFDGRIILKGNVEALAKQIRSALRIQALRDLRPD